MCRIVAYHRVSTDKQGQSGLGLEAQQAAIRAYAAKDQSEIVASFTEVESGKVNTRPELIAALHLAKVTGATLVIAKLDRLSRNAAFLLTLRDSGVRFIAADMPLANELTIGIMALVAQHEREAISSRTRDALAAAKARGTKLGNPNGADALRRANKGNAASRAAATTKADAHASDLKPVIADMRGKGVTSLASIAAELTARSMLTPRGGTVWNRSSVRHLLERLGPVS